MEKNAIKGTVLAVYLQLAFKNCSYPKSLIRRQKMATKRKCTLKKLLCRENKSKWWNTVVGLNHHEVRITFTFTVVFTFIGNS